MVSHWIQDGSERSPPGRVWMDVCHKAVAAMKAQNDAEYGRLDGLMRALEAEYPGEIRAEKAYWGCS